MFGGHYYEDAGGWGAAGPPGGRPGRRFDEYYRCYPVLMMSTERENVNHGGKVILPSSALNKLTRLEISYPMLFELVNGSKGRMTHGGVLEFIAEEGRIYLPQWIMNSLLLEPGDLLQVKSTDLPSGSFIKLQPQSTAFLDISDPKAVLENALRNFSALTKGDIFSFLYNDTVYEIAILEVKPDTKNGAISVTETDIEVDFAAPVGYVEPQKSIPASLASTRPSSAAGGLIAQIGQGAMAAEIGYNSLTPSAPTGIGGTLKVPEAFLRGGQKLSGKKSKNASPAPTPIGAPPAATSSVFKTTTPSSKIINASSMRSGAPVPKPLRLPAGKLFFGYEIKPLNNEAYGVDGEKKEEAFGGSGQTLRGGDGKKGKRKAGDESSAAASPSGSTGGGSKDTKPKTGRTLRGAEVIEVDD